ncbi:MAG: acylneuraminate cytidylyltransferase [Desulfovibrionaceae bacterium]|jgi:CMP-N-acetylneuraminic acid synthetase|nr:acylneuraminate cytidylyltransferase [Desulfovibrionaceae bacterium]
MRIGALVPARLGSRRLARKNIRELGGKPMLCWTVDALLESGVFHDVTVSTESAEVIELVRSRYPADAVRTLLRPARLAADDASLDGVRAHYLENRPALDWCGLFMPTYPFRDPAKLREAQAAILSGHVWRVQTATAETAPIMDYYYPVFSDGKTEGETDGAGGPGDGAPDTRAATGVKRFFHEPNFHCRFLISTYLLSRRDAAEHLWNAYGLSPAERTYFVHADAREAVDVDTAEDFAEAEHVAAGLRRVPRPLEVFDAGSVAARGAVSDANGLPGSWRLVAPRGTDFAAFAAYLRALPSDPLAGDAKPVLVLQTARPHLNFLMLQDGCQRRPWIGPEAANWLRCPEAQRTGDMARLHGHFRHAAHVRVQREFGAANGRALGRTDAYGGFHGMDWSAVPMERVLRLEELERQGFLAPAHDWIG